MMKNKIDYSLVGERIKKQRVILGYSREKFSEMVQIASVYLGQLERGQRTPSLETFVEIASALDCSLDYLVFGDDINKDLDKTEIINLLDKSSTRELKAISDLLNALLPHIKK
jgi:transcriptional regulator with XRE-family HTH domain